MAGILIHLLLFADDIVLVSKSESGLEQLLTIVGKFCDENGLTVSIPKTKCMKLVGSRLQRGDQMAYIFKRNVVEYIDKFKYLGLEFDQFFDLQVMAGARLSKGKKVYGMLVIKLAKLGFYDKRTKLILFDCYVCSLLLFGCNVWGGNLVAYYFLVCLECFSLLTLLLLAMASGALL